jgi:hypothetical protein
MEIAVDANVPTYSGGLGILAGDTLRSAADLHLPMVAVTLLARRGYFFQRLDAQGQQSEEPVHWQVDDLLTDTGETAKLEIEGKDVTLRAWRFDVVSAGNFKVPVYFLDADLPENSPEHRRLTDQLYGGDQRYRLAQETILGIGGVRVLRALGHTAIERFHMNEGHAALLTVELLREQREQAGRTEITSEDIEAVREHCVFTTHTPVPAGHDRFDLQLVERVLGQRHRCGITDAVCHAGQLNMTCKIPSQTLVIGTTIAPPLQPSNFRFVSSFHRNCGELCMNSRTERSLPKIFDRWRAEDRELELRIDELRDWMGEVSQLGIPHFGETATRLGQVRERLVQHFQREDEMVAELARLYPDSSPEIASIRNQSSRDHSQLLTRLDDLSRRLSELEPPFESWQEAMQDVELFVNALEHHEDHESESVMMLMPAGPDQ